MMKTALLLVALVHQSDAQIQKDVLKAIKKDNAALVTMNVKTFGQVESVAEDGDTALLFACRIGAYRSVKVLLKFGADTSKADASGLTVMHIAAASGAARVMQALLTAGVDANSISETDGLRPLHRAVLSGNSDAVKTLLNTDVPSDTPTADGRIPMDFTAELSDVAAVKRTPSPRGFIVDVLKKYSRASGMASGAKAEAKGEAKGEVKAEL